MGLFLWPEGPVWTVLGPSMQYRWLIVSAYQYVWVIFMYWWDQSGQSMVRWVKSFHSVSSYQYVWVGFSWPWWNQSRQSMVRWVKSFHSVRIRLIISAYQYVWVNFSCLMEPSEQSLVLPGSTDGWSYQPISTYMSFLMYWWDQYGQSMVCWVKSFHSVRLRMIISAYQYVLVNFPWHDGPLRTVLSPSRQYRWLIVSAYQYVWVIFHVLMGPLWTVHGPLS